MPAASPLHEHFAFLLGFDVWANAAAAHALTDAFHDEPPGHPLREAVRLFVHVTRSSALWLGRVQQTDDARLDIWPEQVDRALLAEGAGRAPQTAAAWRALLEATPAADLRRPVVYHNLSGTRYETPLAEIVAHVVNHGSHHRGQIARRLREAGIAPPVLDLIAYARSR